jgi:uncharacterized protein YcbX
MHVARIGFTPVKGGRHATHESVELTGAGPAGDRVFCLVDPATDRVVRTVENPTLLQACASWDGVVLSVQLPSVTVAGTPVRTGEVRRIDYWGRTAAVETVDGPWAAAYSTLLGREVVLAASAPGDVVYGGAVTLVTRASLAALAGVVGEPVGGARFRATFEVDGGDLRPYAEEGWVGRRLRLGAAEVRVRSVVPRCAVIDHHPVSGLRDRALLKALAGRRDAPVELGFAVDAEVTVPGQVVTGDAVSFPASAQGTRARPERPPPPPPRTRRGV